MGRSVQYLLLDRPDDADCRSDHDANPPLRRPSSAEGLSTIRTRDLSRDCTGLKIVDSASGKLPWIVRPTKVDIVENWLSRCTGAARCIPRICSPDQFRQ